MSTENEKQEDNDSIYDGIQIFSDLSQRQRDCSTVSQPSAASQEVHHIITYEPFRRCVNYLIAHSRYLFSVKITI